MKPAVVTALFVQTFLIGPAVLPAFEWPVRDPLLVSTFGESRDGQFHTGLDLTGEGQSVYPIEIGETVFSFEEGELGTELPSGLGSFIVLEHDGGLRSSYSHLEAGSVERGVSSLSPADVIGVIGSTGYAEKPHLHLQITDRELEQLVNPLLVLPQEENRAAPVIRNVSLLYGNELVPVTDGATVPAGDAVLVAELYDQNSITGTRVTAPYKILVLHNGLETFQLTFDALALSGDRLVFSPSNEIDFSALYHTDTMMKLGKLTLITGKAQLEISAADFRQNRSVASFAVTVR